MSHFVFFRYFGARLVAAAGVELGHRVLDVATGRGAVSTFRVTLAEDLSEVLREMRLNTPVPGWITDPDALRLLLEQAGFGDAWVREHAATFTFRNVEAYWQNVSGSLRRTLDGLNATQRRDVMATLVERLRDRHGPDGISVTTSALIGVATR